MTTVPEQLQYTAEHEWVSITGQLATVGITEHAANALGDVVYVELPKLGSSITAGSPFGVIESTKAVSELFAPINGKVVKVDEALTSAPQTVNEDPYGAGWLIQVEPSDPRQLDQLLDSAAYQKLIQNKTA